MLKSVVFASLLALSLNATAEVKCTASGKNSDLEITFDRVGNYNRMTLNYKKRSLVYPYLFEINEIVNEKKAAWCRLITTYNLDKGNSGRVRVDMNTEVLLKALEGAPETAASNAVIEYQYTRWETTIDLDKGATKDSQERRGHIAVKCENLSELFDSIDQLKLKREEADKAHKAARQAQQESDPKSKPEAEVVKLNDE